MNLRRLAIKGAVMRLFYFGLGVFIRGWAARNGRWPDIVDQGWIAMLIISVVANMLRMRGIGGIALGMAAPAMIVEVSKLLDQHFPVATEGG